MGIWERPTEAFLDSARQRVRFRAAAPSRLRHGGINQGDARGRRAKVFFALGGNFLSATPDTEYTAAALRRCRLTAHVSTKLNRAHSITGEQALILPCLGRTESDVQAAGPQFVSVRKFDGRRASLARAARAGVRASVERAGDRRAARRQRRSARAARVDWLKLAGDYDRIRAAIERVIPGFEDYNRRVREPGGFYLPNLARERRFKTATGRANFTVHELPRHDLAPGQFLMMTMRSHDQFNTTIYGLDDRYRGIYNGRRVVFLNPRRRGRGGTRSRANSSTSSATSRTSERTAPRLRRRALQHPAPLRRDLLPRGQRARPHRQRRRQEQHAGLEIRRHKSASFARSRLIFSGRRA